MTIRMHIRTTCTCMPMPMRIRAHAHAPYGYTHRGCCRDPLPERPLPTGGLAIRINRTKFLLVRAAAEIG